MTSSSEIRVLLVTGGGASHSSLYERLHGFSGITVVASADSTQEMLQSLKSEQVDVIVLDLGAFNGIEFTRKVREFHPGVKVLMLTGSNHEEDIFTAIDTGADGYVLRGNDKGLEMAIRSLRLGTVWLDPAIAAQVLDAIVTASRPGLKRRTLPTGMFLMPLLPDEKNLLQAVSASNCTDGVCMVDPDFMKKLRRFAPAQDQTIE